jgi:hypothetical protein
MKRMAGTEMSCVAVPALHPRLALVKTVVAKLPWKSLPQAIQPIQRLGRSGVVAAMLCALAAGVWLFGSSPASRSESDLRLQISQSRVLAAQSSGVRAVTPQDFLSRLPRQAELPAAMASLFKQATAAEIELQRGHYELVKPKSGGPGRYELLLPVKGSYAAVRKFIEGSLAAVPAAALEGIRLQRDDISTSDVEAELRFVVFVQGSP